MYLISDFALKFATMSHAIRFSNSESTSSAKTAGRSSTTKAPHVPSSINNSINTHTPNTAPSTSFSFVRE